MSKQQHIMIPSTPARKWLCDYANTHCPDREIRLEAWCRSCLVGEVKQMISMLPGARRPGEETP